MPEKQKRTRAWSPRFEPPAEQMALWPDISGNAVNGLGETTGRRPSHVYWWDPEKTAHGRLQLYFYERNSAPELKAAQARRKPILDEPLVGVADEKTATAPAAAADAVKAEIRRLSAEDVGIATLSPDWVFEDCTVDLPWLVVFAVAMDYVKLSQAPDVIAGAEVVDQYARANKIAKGVTNWIRDRGYRAEPMAGPMAESVTLIPAAIAAGLGELGKHGSMIHPELGSSFRLAAVATDLPLVADAPIEFGADEFCTRCQACSNACPPQAIFEEKQLVRGARKWYVDFDRCLPYFNETAGCAVCLAACPWSKPGVADKLLVKLAQKAQASRSE